MVHRTKAVAGTVALVLAIAALAAQGAAAAEKHEFTSSVNQTIVTATGLGEQVFEIGEAAIPAKVECSIMSASDTKAGETVDQITIHPKYSSCKTFLEGKNVGSASINTNGCNYVFDSDTTEALPHIGGQEHASMSIECQTGKSIVISTLGCIITIGGSSSSLNQSLHGIRYIKEGSSSGADILVRATMPTVHLVLSGLCPSVGLANGTYKKGEYYGDATVKGYADPGAPTEGSTETGTVWNHVTQVGISLETSTNN